MASILVRHKRAARSQNAVARLNNVERELLWQSGYGQTGKHIIRFFMAGYANKPLYIRSRAQNSAETRVVKPVVEVINETRIGVDRQKFGTLGQTFQNVRAKRPHARADYDEQLANCPNNIGQHRKNRRQRGLRDRTPHHRVFKKPPKKDRARPQHVIDGAGKALLCIFCQLVACHACVLPVFEPVVEGVALKTLWRSAPCLPSRFIEFVPLYIDTYIGTYIGPNSR